MALVDEVLHKQAKPLSEVGGGIRKKLAQLKEALNYLSTIAKQETRGVDYDPPINQ